MTSFRTLRTETAKRPRRIVGLLTLAWLSVVAQPCAMAFGAAPDADCLHCPPGATADAHHAADDTAAESAAAANCDGPLSGCYVLSDTQFDSRSPVAKIKDAPVELPALLPSVALPSAGRTVTGTADCSSSAAPPGERRSLSVLYCVYRK